tara:strand:+ start:563 stop:1342 length:780 start_codon:yes stop_codon:yes gene_type:complete
MKKSDAVLFLTGGVGDQVCASGALNSFYKKHKKKFYIFTDKPSLFLEEDYCKDVIHIDFLNNSGHDDRSKIFKNFNRLYLLTWQTENHIKGNCTSVENYCEQLNVDKIKYPYLKIDREKLSKFNFNKPHILVSFNRKEISDDFILKKTKYFTAKKTTELILNLKKDLPEYDIIDLADINTNNLKDLVYAVANCKTFISTDTALQHIAANEALQRKGVVLWNNEKHVEIYGYKHNINLVNNFVYPYDDYEVILQNLKRLL